MTQATITAPDVERLWRARPELAHLEQAARARLASPWAVLGATLVNVLSAVPPHIMLPPLVGGAASLNLFVAIVGGSGLGKGAAVSTAAAAFNIVSDAPRLPLGSGEGLAKAIAAKEGIETPDGAKITTTVVHTPSVIFETSEVDQLAALGGRQGATLMPQLRSAWSGETLGASYADQAKAVIIPAHEYRIGLILGVQPRRAGALLDESDGGTPQRFLWLQAADPHARDGDSWPQPHLVPRVEWPALSAYMQVPANVTKEIRANRIRVLNGSGETLNGHLMLTRLKVAAGLAILNGRTDIELDDWDLAGMVIDHSNSTRAFCVRAIRDIELEDAQRKGENRAHADHAASTRTAKLSAVERIANNIAARLEDGQTWTRGELARAQAGRDRAYVDESLGVLVREGRAVKLSPTEFRQAGDP
ncbi:MAG: hypothetical protein ACTH31_09970 [Pseudoclavibacter sp.]